MVGTPVCLTLCHCRACGGDGASTLLVYFVFFLMSLPASSPLPPPPQHSPVMFGRAWLKMTSPPEVFMAEDIARHVSRTCQLPLGAECCVSDVPSGGLVSVGTLRSPLGLRVSLGGPVGTWGRKSTGTVAWVKRSVVTVKRLLKRQILGVIWLNEAREVGTSPGDLSAPALPTGDVGRAAGDRHSPSPARGVRADGLPASQPAGHSSLFQLEVATQQHMRTVKSNPVSGRAALKPRESPNLKA